jgi:hypothetical protein
MGYPSLVAFVIAFSFYLDAAAPGSVLVAGRVR